MSRASVTGVTLSTEQLAFARLTIEPKLAELAGARVTPALIARLSGLDDQVNAAIRSGDISAYLESNHAFHFALYEASEAADLVDMARSLWLRFGPSPRGVAGLPGATSLADNHAGAPAAMRAGDLAGVSEAMRNDIAQGVDQVRAALESGAV